jgi:hypothetical protein
MIPAATAMSRKPPRLNIHALFSLIVKTAIA